MARSKITPKQRRFISEKIRVLVHEGRPQRQAIAIAYRMAGVPRPARRDPGSASRDLDAKQRHASSLSDRAQAAEDDHDASRDRAVLLNQQAAKAWLELSTLYEVRGRGEEARDAYFTYVGHNATANLLRREVPQRKPGGGFSGGYSSFGGSDRDPPMRRRELLRQLEGCGARLVREGGGHTIYASPRGAQLVVPRHTEVSPGVTRKLLRAGCGETARRDARAGEELRRRKLATRRDPIRRSLGSAREAEDFATYIRNHGGSAIASGTSVVVNEASPDLLRRAFLYADRPPETPLEYERMYGRKLAPVVRTPSGLTPRQVKEYLRRQLAAGGLLEEAQAEGVFHKNPSRRRKTKKSSRDSSGRVHVTPPPSDVTRFALRISRGDRLTSREDLQFYANHAEAIERELRGMIGSRSGARKGKWWATDRDPGLRDRSLASRRRKRRYANR